MLDRYDRNSSVKKGPIQSFTGLINPTGFVCGSNAQCNDYLEWADGAPFVSGAQNFSNVVSNNNGVKHHHFTDSSTRVDDGYAYSTYSGICVFRI